MHWIDPASLPAITGCIASFTRNRHGDVDGVLLDDDKQVHVPPHMGAGLERLFRIGDTLEARYVKPRGADLYAAVSVSTAGGKTLLDEGPVHGEPREPMSTRPVELDGRVRRTLYAPKGEVCGAVLETGEQLRVDPKHNEELAPYFEPGAEVRVWGERFKRKQQTVIEVAEIGYSKDF